MFNSYERISAQKFSSLEEVACFLVECKKEISNHFGCPPTHILFAWAASKLRVKFNAQLYFLGFFSYYMILYIKTEVYTRMFIVKLFLMA